MTFPLSPGLVAVYSLVLEDSKTLSEHRRAKVSHKFRKDFGLLPSKEVLP